MSTHNVGFYEEMEKIISQLSSNIVKYTLYLFFCNAGINEPLHEKTGFLHMQKQRRRSASR